MKLKTLCACLALVYAYAGDVFAEETLSLGNTKTDIEKLKTDNEQFKHQKRKNGSIKMSEDEYKSLMEAVDNGNYEKVKSFMDKGFDLNTSYPGTYEGMTALQYASMKDNVDIVKLLIENGADVNFQEDKHKYRPLGRAISHGNRDIIGLLLENGADPNISGQNKISLMEMIDKLIAGTEAKKSMEIITLLLNYGADQSLRNEDGQTALMYALKNGSRIECILELSKLLLTYADDPTEPVLDLIYRGKYKQKVSDEYITKKKQKLLFDINAKDFDINAKDKEGKTALMHALTYKRRIYNTVVKRQTSGSTHVELVKLLLSHGANPNLKNNEGKTALMYAVTRRNPNIKAMLCVLELLLSHGADPDIKNDYGDTALMLLFQDVMPLNELITVLELLLSHKANPNAQNNNGETALMMAVWDRPHAEAAHYIIALLLSYGADPNIKNNFGKKALDYAQRQIYVRNNSIAIQMLEGKVINLTRSYKFSPPVLNDELFTDSGFDSGDWNSDSDSDSDSDSGSEIVQPTSSDSDSDSDSGSDSDFGSKVVQPTKSNASSLVSTSAARSAIEGKSKASSTASNSNAKSDSDSDSEVVQPTKSNASSLVSNSVARSAIKGKSKASSSTSTSAARSAIEGKSKASSSASNSNAKSDSDSDSEIEQLIKSMNKTPYDSDWDSDSDSDSD